MSIARVRVEAKYFGKGTDSDRKRAFSIMFAEFKRRVSDAGILKLLKERQFFQSKSEKLRKKKKEALNKRKTEEVEQKLRSGIRVQGEAKLVKKIQNNMKAKSKKNRKDNRDFSKGNYVEE